MKRPNAMKALAAALLFLLPAALCAQLWRLEPNLSFSTFSLGWEPFDAAYAATGYLGALNGGEVKLGYGLALDKYYYLLIPERETAIHAYAGYEARSAAATGFSPGGAAEAAGPYRDYRGAYVDLGVEQVLLGDRRSSDAWLMLSLGDVSRFSMPQAAGAETEAPPPFFTHSPRAALSFSLYRRMPFWRVLGLSGSCGATLEAGHSDSIGPWSFLMADADLGFKLPVIGEYLYADGHAALSALVANYSPGVRIPAYSYSGYADAASLSASLDLKSRALKTDFLVPMAIEFGLGAVARTQAPELAAIDPLSAALSYRAFADFAADAGAVGGMRIRVGASYDPRENAFGFILSLAN